MRTLLSIVMFVFMAVAYGACVRYDTTAKPLNAPEFDGPGSFDQLQDTVTLDCLTYVGSIRKDSKEYVLIKDERDIVHQLSVGDYMGENTGMIMKISDDVIYIEQNIRRNGKREPAIIKLAK
ncbi:MAG: pilus assembly protein PilP [Methylobacter sp.]|uniref:pilus assembly protein PilP n=1 Tax=Methylobacter sp. TaxID=2051955 RepID=UPI002730299B|nr:pilus assembly protein PilP [Methylobacter sp.]MDP1667254.1 pilus assembly protein PilP [Methylobacter sp.]